MTKAFRQAQVQKIIRAGGVSTQEQLAAKLSAEGVSVTQVTLSRDLRELRVVKTPEGYRDAETIGAKGPAPDNLARVLKEFLRDVQPAQNLVVLKTHPGGANAVALALDAEQWPEIVGTVAGDDTIFVAAPDGRAAKKLRARLIDVW